MKAKPPARHYLFRILLRTILRFSPFCKPVVPALVTMWVLAATFSLLWCRDLILHTFMPGYRELALSAWGFILLMNFLESLGEVVNGTDEDE